MNILSVSGTYYNTPFKMEFKLSEKTLDYISKSTKLTVQELHNLPLDEASKIMRERGAIKEPSKFKQWLSEKYRQFGERNGLLKKYINIYTDVD